MIIRYFPISPYGYPLLSAITLWLSVIVRYHPMVSVIRIVRYHPMIIRYCPLSPYDYPLFSDITL